MRIISHLIFLAMIAFFLCFFVMPILTTLQVAFVNTKGGFTLDYVWEVFRNGLYREGLWNSFILAVWSLAGCLLFSIPLAILYNRYRFPGKDLLHGLLLAPMILPPFVGAIGVRAILGQAGALNSLLIHLGLMNAAHPADWLGHGQVVGIVLMNVLHLYPILYLNVTAALGNLDPALDEAAATLGGAPFARVWHITLPLIMPGIFAGSTIVFIWAFTELGVPLVFDFTRVSSVQIFNGLKDLGGNPFPYALVTVMLVITGLLYLVSKLAFERRIGRVDSGRTALARTEIELARPVAITFTILFSACIALAILPHLGVILLSLSSDWYQTVLPQGLTLQHFHDALGSDLTLSSVANSLKYASLATLVDLILGVGIAYVNTRTRLWGRHLLDAMAMLPLAVPGLVMAFGYWAMTREGQRFHWLMLGENPLVLLVIAYSVRRLPYMVRSATAGFQQINVSLEEAAQNLGASPSRTFLKVTLPLVAPNLLAGALLAFALAMLEVADSLILAQQSVHYPITKALYVLLNSLGDGPWQAAALGVWAMIFLGVILAGVGLLLGRRLGSILRM